MEKAKINLSSGAKQLLFELGRAQTAFVISRKNEYTEELVSRRLAVYLDNTAIEATSTGYEYYKNMLSRENPTKSLGLQEMQEILNTIQH